MLKSFLKSLFCKHEYITDNISAYRGQEPPEGLLNATDFHCRCKKCGKKKIFSSKWW